MRTIPLYNMFFDNVFWVFLVIFIISVLVFFIALKKVLAGKETCGTDDPDDYALSDESDEEAGNDASTDPEAPASADGAGAEKDRAGVFSAAAAEEKKPGSGDNLYAEIRSLKKRVEDMEKSAPQASSGFTEDFIAALLRDFDSMDKGKIKKRLEYLLEDIRAERGGR